MSKLPSRVMFAIVGGLAAGALLLGGCAPTLPASAAQVATSAPAAATTAPVASPAAVASPAIDAARTITVVGHGEASGKPEVARSSIGIEVLAPTVGEAMAEARTRMDAVIKALKGAGIADKDLQTSNFSVNFERQGPVAGPVKEPAAGATADIAGQSGVYRVNNMVNVTIRDLDKVSTVLDAAVNAGANNVWGISFSVDNTANLEAQAREKAVADARARAESLAKLNGVNVGPVMSVSEVIGSPSPKFAMDRAAVGLGGGGTPVEPGEIAYSTDIQVVYAIR